MAPDGDAIRIQSHNDVPREVLVTENSVVARRDGIVLLTRPGSEPHRQVVRGNRVTAAEPVSAGS